MSVPLAFTIEQFYKFLEQKKLMAGKCLTCGKIHLPPRPLCDSCYGQLFEWLEISGRGKLLTYTVIHVVPSQFQAIAPYAVGIVQLEKGLRILGLILGVSAEQLNVGMDLVIDFVTCATDKTWPQWQRYCFRPV